MEPVEPPLVSFVMLHYRDVAAANALAAETVQAFGDSELIIVDNSGDFTLRADLEQNNIRIITPGYNSGFARGVNFGLRAAAGHYMALINQDVTGIHAIRPLVEKLDKNRPEKTITGVRLLSAHGEFQQSIWPDYPTFSKEWKGSTFYSYFGGRENSETRQKKIGDLHKESGRVERLNGAFLLFHRSLVDDDLLLWDEDFFLYGEDVEWAWRCNRAGRHFYYDSAVALGHVGSASSPDVSVKNLQVILSDFLFVAKTHNVFYTLFFLAFVRMSSAFDLFLLRRRGPQMDRAMWANRKMKVYLTRKYGWRLLGRHGHAHPQKFLFNCYENDQAFAATLSNQG